MSAMPAQGFLLFESPVTHGLALSPDRTRLFAVNPPDNRLSVFDLRNPAAPMLLGEVPVGLEPVAVAARNDSEVWVVNHLSDAISIVEVDSMECVATLQCSDEPADIVFSGGSAFVSCATKREVMVFDAASRQLQTVIPVFADEPRALTTAGGMVYVASARSGNGTTILPADLAPPPPSPTNALLPPAPQVGQIIRADDPAWSSQLPLSLPDHDVFEIDAATLQVTREFAGLGTSIFALAIEPGGAALWATNTEARNLVAFEPNLRGHVVDNRLTRVSLSQSAATASYDLNPGVDYSVLPNPGAIASSLAQPMGAAWSPNGSELYIAAFGTDRLGVVDAQGNVTARIEIGTTTTSPGMATGKRGPRALVHHGQASLLYVFNRLTNSVSIVDTATRLEVREIAIGYDPTPPMLQVGRDFLYDAKRSGNGTASCASCHIDALHDGLAWDLGDRGGNMAVLPAEIMVRGEDEPVHPMKGPMLTQTLQGLRGSAPYHWRGDRADLTDFNATFATLLGGSPLQPAELDAFITFLQSIAFPPNPNQHRDRSLPQVPVGSSAQDGLDFFQIQTFSSHLTQNALCIDCHPLWSMSLFRVVPAATLGESQPFDIPTLFGVHKRIPQLDAANASTSGFGVAHDGSRLDVIDLHNRTASHLYDGPERLQAFINHLDSGIAPSVGLQQTLDSVTISITSVQNDWQLLEQSAAVGDCDLVLRGHIGEHAAAFVYDAVSNRYLPHTHAGAPASRGTIAQAIAAGARFTMLGVARGDGRRIAVDRDNDGRLDDKDGMKEYGTGSSGCSLRLRGNSRPEVGNDAFAFVTVGAQPGAAGIVLIGGAPANYTLAGLPILVEPIAASAMYAPADARGVGVAPRPIPATAALSGLTLYAQTFSLTPCGASPVTASSGLAVEVQ